MLNHYHAYNHLHIFLVFWITDLNENCKKVNTQKLIKNVNQGINHIKDVYTFLRQIKLIHFIHFSSCTYHSQAEI